MRFLCVKPIDIGMIAMRLTLISRQAHFPICVDRFSCTAWGTGAGAAEAHAVSPVRIAKTKTFILLGDEIALECGDWLTDDWGSELKYRFQCFWDSVFISIEPRFYARFSESMQIGRAMTFRFHCSRASHDTRSFLELICIYNCNFNRKVWGEPTLSHPMTSFWVKFPYTIGIRNFGPNQKAGVRCEGCRR